MWTVMERKGSGANIMPTPRIGPSVGVSILRGTELVTVHVRPCSSSAAGKAILYPANGLFSSSFRTYRVNNVDILSKLTSTYCQQNVWYYPGWNAMAGCWTHARPLVDEGLPSVVTLDAVRMMTSS